jgi:hypothetical protein
VGRKIVPIDLSEVTIMNRSGMTQTQVVGDRSEANYVKGRGVTVKNETHGNENIPAVS